jgi:hypothetical protein
MDIPVPLDPLLISRFAKIVGDRYALTEAADIAPFVSERRGRFPGRTGLVLKPGSIDEVSCILVLATATRTPIVPQGGNTGLVGGQMPAAPAARSCCRCRGSTASARSIRGQTPSPPRPA